MITSTTVCFKLCLSCFSLKASWCTKLAPCRDDVPGQITSDSWCWHHQTHLEWIKMLTDNQQHQDQTFFNPGCPPYEAVPDGHFHSHFIWLCVEMWYWLHDGVWLLIRVAERIKAAIRTSLLLNILKEMRQLNKQWRSSFAKHSDQVKNWMSHSLQTRSTSTVDKYMHLGSYLKCKFYTSEMWIPKIDLTWEDYRGKNWSDCSRRRSNWSTMAAETEPEQIGHRE